ncbi:hypothetical protein JCM10212_006794 [Sporobolomyces blumeae]
MAFPTTPSQKFRQALASPTSSLSLLDRLYDKLRATQPILDPIESLRNTDPSTRQTSLHVAVNAGRLDVVEWLLDLGVESDISRDAAGETVLHVAAAKGFIDIMLVYLDRFRFVIDWVNARGMTPLHTAAMRGEVDAAQVLIDAGSDIDAPDLFGNSPLHYGLSWGKLSVVKLLVDLDCETDIRNNQGYSPSDVAFSFAAVDALKVYVRIRQDAVKAARRSESRRPRNPRIDSGASSRSRHRSASHQDATSSALSVVSVPPISPNAPDVFPLQPSASIRSPASPQASSVASPALSEPANATLPGRYGLGVRLNGTSTSGNSRKGKPRSTSFEAHRPGRDSPLPAPVPVRPPATASTSSLVPNETATPQTPQAGTFPDYGTTSPAQSPVQPPPSSNASSPPLAPSRSPTVAGGATLTTTKALHARPRSLSPLSQRRASQASPRSTPVGSSSYFPAAVAESSSTPGSYSASTVVPTPSATPALVDGRASSPTPASSRVTGLHRVSSTDANQNGSLNGGAGGGGGGGGVRNKLRKKAARRASMAEPPVHRSASSASSTSTPTTRLASAPSASSLAVGSGPIPEGSTILGGGPDGKKLRSERSMSFGAAMASTGDVPGTRGGGGGGGGGGGAGLFSQSGLGMGAGAANGGGFVGRSRSSTNRSFASMSSSSDGSEVPGRLLGPISARTSRSNLSSVVSGPTASEDGDPAGSGRLTRATLQSTASSSSNGSSRPSDIASGANRPELQLAPPIPSPPVALKAPPRLAQAASPIATAATMSAPSREPDAAIAKPVPSSVPGSGPGQGPSLIPVVVDPSSLTTRSHEPGFVVVRGSTTKSSPNPNHPGGMTSGGPTPRPVSGAFTSGHAPPSSAPVDTNRPPLSPVSTRTSISIGRPSTLASSTAGAAAGPQREVAKLRKSSGPKQSRDRSASEVSRDSKATGGGGGRLARALGFGGARKVT